jgi:hypothetical protein
MPIESAGLASMFAGALFIIMAIVAVLVLIMVISTWKIYTKAGREGWESIVPVYNLYVMLLIARLPAWTIILYFIPIVNIAFAFYVSYKFVETFGKGIGYAIGCVFLPFIFYPMLAFGDSVYLGGTSNDASATPVAPTAPEQNTQAPVAEPAPQVTEQPVTPTAPTSTPQ